MPIILPDGLPAANVLRGEGLTVLSPAGAAGQKPLELLLVNLMPNKLDTELQLARVLAGSPLPVRLTLLRTRTHASAHVPAEHLAHFYCTLADVRARSFDGIIITGAPIELMPFEAVDYWPELLDILDYARAHARSVIYLCWAAMAALWRQHGIEKYTMPQKLHGVFEHRSPLPHHPLMQGIDDRFWVPHSRAAAVDVAAVSALPGIRILAESGDAGLHIAATEASREIFIFGHSEYDADTLWNEYNRDLDKNPHAAIPRNYFYGDDPACGVHLRWRAAGRLFYLNWLHNVLLDDTPL